MLLDNKFTIIPSIKFTLTYDNGVRKVVTVKTRDTIDCSYKKNGEKFSIVGVVAKIGCNFNSSLGTVGTTAYLQIDGSSQYVGQVEYIQPSQVLDLHILSTTDVVDNVVCSVDNDDQRVTLIRENEVGVFQYSTDGITWNAATGAQGMSAYQCAVELGFVGTEEEWLKSLHGEQGEPGEPGALEIFRVYNSIEDAETDRMNVPKGKLVAVTNDAHPEIGTQLFVRKTGDSSCPCPVCGCTNTPSTIKGYKFVGYLTVGPKGDPGKAGKPGKSAYEYAVEGGYPGSEAEFMKALADNSLRVTSFYMGPSPRLTNTVIGPIDLRVFGYTDTTTFRSKYIRQIDVSSPTETEDQSLLFRDAIVLRAVPTNREAAKPNIIIKGKKYVADVIMSKNGKIGVFRRVEYIDSYDGEAIIGDWISSTGELDMGAHVQYTTLGTFEPFAEEIQAKYRKLHTYDGETHINTTEGTYVSVSYPIDVATFINDSVSTKVVEYLEEHAPALITPIVNDIVDQKIVTKQDKLTAGNNIEIDAETSTISVTGLDTVVNTAKFYTDTKNAEAIAHSNANLDTAKTYTDNAVAGAKTYTDGKISTLTTTVNGLKASKQDKLTAGNNITISANGVISSTANSAIAESFTTTKAVGGITAGTVIEAGTQIADLLKQILCPDVPPEDQCVYWGVSNGAPTTIEGMTKESVPDATLIQGIAHRFTSNNQNFVFAYKKSIGELISIKDSSGFENMDGWSRTELLVGNNTPFYVYYSNEALTVTSYKLTFIFLD